jgi:hypothetical protein
MDVPLNDDDRRDETAGLPHNGAGEAHGELGRGGRSQDPGRVFQWLGTFGDLWTTHPAFHRAVIIVPASYLGRIEDEMGTRACVLRVRKCLRATRSSNVEIPRPNSSRTRLDQS